MKGLAKNLKTQIKNVQIAGAINLSGLKAKLSKKKEGEEGPGEEAAHVQQEAVQQEKKKKAPSRPKEQPAEVEVKAPVAPPKEEPKVEVPKQEVKAPAPKALPVQAEAPKVAAEAPAPVKDEKMKLGPVFREAPKPPAPKPPAPKQEPAPRPVGHQSPSESRPSTPPAPKPPYQPPASRPVGSWKSVSPQRFTPQARPPGPRLGPIERHPHESSPSREGRPPYPPRGPRPPGPPRPPGAPRYDSSRPMGPRPPGGGFEGRRPPIRPQPIPQQKPEARSPSDKKEFPTKEGDDRRKAKAKETASKPMRKIDTKEFEVRIRHGLRGDEDEEGWRKRRPSKHSRIVEEQEIIRPTKISIRLPISVKDLASEMKLKASQLIAKLFLQGQIMTLNDMLEDDTTVQLIGHEFGCDVTIDTKEEERIRITDKTLREEVQATEEGELSIRPPVVTFMGHVDHGKTSLIDTIRKSNTAQHEVGAITQHIGAFKVSTSHGDIAVLDTPGHEAFSHMRERGAEVTDIVVLVVAGDEGMKMQTLEALSQAKASKATIVVAINKCDKPAFNVENVYRQLAEQELLPEAWGGQTITVNTSAVTGEGIPQLLEMLALQAEVLELKANKNTRARGTVIESEVEKGMGPVATVLVQNGTLRVGDSLVFGFNWARVKTMKDEHGRDLEEAGPSTPVRINGLSGVPESGEEFIVVKNEREARDISQVRHEGKRTTSFHTKRRSSLESMLEQAQEGAPKKILTLIIRADVQGSCEALKNALMKIDSKKVEVNVISSGVGMISESDVQLAVASKAVIIGFHTQMESHVEAEIKELGVKVVLHDIIYHAIDDIRLMMLNLLDKIVQEKDVGKAEVKATFKSSQLGIIAGCQVTDGSISRNNQIRVMRNGTQVFKGPISSLKRVKEDVREVQKGAECGILLQGFSDYQVGDILEAFEIIYLTQEL